MAMLEVLAAIGMDDGDGEEAEQPPNPVDWLFEFLEKKQGGAQGTDVLVAVDRVGLGESAISYALSVWEGAQVLARSRDRLFIHDRYTRTGAIGEKVLGCTENPPKPRRRR